jgi:two-component system, NarL family, response regulator LiaR
VSQQDTIRIAIVDDHPMVREGLRAFLQLSSDIDIVAEVGTGAEAVELAESEAIDVMLMDLVMPGKYDGVAAIRSIAESHPDIHIIALTSYQEKDRMVGAIQAGAISYLQKDVSPEDLLTAIRQAAVGRTVLDPAALDALRSLQNESGSSGTPVHHGRSTSSAGRQEALTQREQDVLEALAQGMSNKEIAAELGIAEKTVKVHISHILGKLGVYDRTQALLAASRRGLIQLQ